MTRRDYLFSGAAGALLAACSSKVEGPARYRVKFETTKGDFLVDVVREWSPNGADRFYELVTTGFYDGARFFRVVPGFVVQFGLKGDPAADAKWDDATIEDDTPRGMSNLPATVVFAAKQTPNTRSSQVFINLGQNQRLDAMGFTPFGRVSEGMAVVAAINNEYGEAPDQMRIKTEGNAYLERDFPRLDFIKKASVVPGE
ncbi:MAG: peptidylprolyl isomerase [Bryobacteraceae bacterium]